MRSVEWYAACLFDFIVNIFAKKHLDVMQKIEDKAWSILSPNEQRTLVNALSKMNQILGQEIAHLKYE